MLDVSAATKTNKTRIAEAESYLVGYYFSILFSLAVFVRIIEARPLCVQQYISKFQASDDLT